MNLIAYDTELKRPACAILQVAYGATPGIASHFDTRTWLIDPTPAMEVYRVSDEELAILVATARRDDGRFD